MRLHGKAAIDAVVVDEGQTWRGLAAIRNWQEGPASLYQYTTEVQGAERTGEGTYRVTGRLAGTFPGGTADLTTAAGVSALASRAHELLGWVDIIVHNVGGSSSPPGGVLALTDEHWQANLDANLFAAVRLDRALLPAIIERGSGVILHVSSIQRRMPLHSTVAYAAAKAALSNYSKALANEVGPQGIRVNTISPGMVQTAAATRLIGRIAAERGTDDAAARQILIESLGGIPIGRPARPEEVAVVLDKTVQNNYR